MLKERKIAIQKNLIKPINFAYPFCMLTGIPNILNQFFYDYEDQLDAGVRDGAGDAVSKGRFDR